MRVYVVSEMIFVRNLPIWVWWITLYKTCGFCLIIFPVVIIGVSVSMKPVKEKWFVVFWTWWRIEVDSKCAVDKTPEDISSMRLGFEVIKLYVWSSIHHFKYLLKMEFWRAVIRTSIGLAWVVILSTKTILIFAWLSSNIFDGGPMG